jgi:mono/diheme cytochrome c family protein
VNFFSSGLIALGFVGALELGVRAEPAQEIGFFDQGVQQKSLTLSELQKVSPAQVVKVKNPIDGAVTEFRAFPVLPILKSIYGERFAAADEVQLKCADGYQPTVSASRFRQRVGYLAYERADGKSFVATQKSPPKKTTVLGPFYLVWETGPSVAAVELDTAWPYQVVGVDLVEFKKKFSRIYPPEGASDSVKAGFLEFKQRCLKCHTVNGQGGDMGPELNVPVNVTEYFDQKWLAQWIENPSLVRRGAKMPSGVPDLLKAKPPHRSEAETTEKRKQVVQQILEYLSAMKAKKASPAELQSSTD